MARLPTRSFVLSIFLVVGCACLAWADDDPECAEDGDCHDDGLCPAIGGCDGDVCTGDKCDDGVCVVAEDPDCDDSCTFDRDCADCAVRGGCDGNICTVPACVEERCLEVALPNCDPDTCVINDDCFEDRRCRSLGGCDGDVCTTDACVDSVCQVARDPSCINTPLCDHDTDSDGICDGDDNCPDLANPDQADRDDNGLGDVCQESGDGETHLTDAGGASPDEGTADNCSTVSSASAAVPSGWVFLFCAAYLGLIRRRGESRPA